MTKLSLQRLSVTGFRGVRDTVTLNFTDTPPGLYFIKGENKAEPKLGSNGAGKSSLFTESLEWLLTGSLSRSRRPGADVECRGWQGKTEVVGEFAIDDANRVASRTRNPNGLYLDGEKVEQERIDALLPIADAALRRSILIGQFGEMFLDLRPEAKSRIFTETLNLDKWLRAADVAIDRAKGAEKQLEVNTRQAEGAKRALAEVRDQYEAARKGEKRFEDELKVLIAAARKREREAKVMAESCREALDAAREKHPPGSADSVRELNNMKQMRRSAQTLSLSAAVRLAAAEREVETLTNRLSAYAGKVEVCPECGQRVGAAHVAERRLALSGELEIAREKCEVCKMEADSSARELARVEKRMAALEESTADALKVQAEVAVAAERSFAADRDALRASSELAELKARVNPFAAQCDALEERIESLREDLVELERRTAEVNETLEVAKFWVRGFKEIRLEQIDAALAELELATNRHAESLGLSDWQIAFATERETNRGAVSLGFTVSLYPPGAEEPVSWETYSGGESQRWQLATAFGLAEVLLARAGVSTDFEVLDEPTSHLSPEGIEDLLSCLYDRAIDCQRRIFLIDHNSLDRGAFDGVVVVEKTDKWGTRVSDDGGVVKTKQNRVFL